MESRVNSMTEIIFEGICSSQKKIIFDIANIDNPLKNFKKKQSQGLNILLRYHANNTHTFRHNMLKKLKNHIVNKGSKCCSI